jgi:hypothetical protein
MQNRLMMNLSQVFADPTVGGSMWNLQAAGNDIVRNREMARHGR